MDPNIPIFLDKIIKKAYSFLEKIIDESEYLSTDSIKFPNLEILLECFPSFKFTLDTEIKKKLKNNLVTDIFGINDIDSYSTVENIISEININLSENMNLNASKKSLDVITEKINTFLNFKKKNDDLEIEQLINKEFYNIKNNLSFITTSNFTSGTISNDEFSVYNF